MTVLRRHPDRRTGNEADSADRGNPRRGAPRDLVRETGAGLADPARFLAYAMTYGTHEDMQTIRQHVTDGELREALDKAPPASSTHAPGPTGI